MLPRDERFWTAEKKAIVAEADGRISKERDAAIADLKRLYAKKPGAIAWRVLSDGSILTITELKGTWSWSQQWASGAPCPCFTAITGCMNE